MQSDTNSPNPPKAKKVLKDFRDLWIFTTAKISILEFRISHLMLLIWLSDKPKHKTWKGEF